MNTLVSGARRSNALLPGAATGPVACEARTLSCGSLTALWNLAFGRSDFSSRTHLEWHAIDLQLSRVLLAGPEPVGVSLASRRGALAHLVHFGIVPMHRGKRWARLLLDAQVAAAQEAGLKAVRLEVLEHNLPAISLYEGAGFEARFVLQVFKGQMGTFSVDDPTDLVPLDLPALRRLHDRLSKASCGDRRRERAAMARTLGFPGVVALAVKGRCGRHEACAVVQESQGRAALHHAEVSGPAAASALLSGLAARYPSVAWQPFARPIDSLLAKAAQRTTLEQPSRQLEMIRALAAGTGH